MGEQSELQKEKLRLEDELGLLEESFEADRLRLMLADFASLFQEITPADLQRLLRLLVRRIEFHPNGSSWIEVYNAPRAITTKVENDTEMPFSAFEFESNVRFG